jgi:hypothetical protein
VESREWYEVAIPIRRRTFHLFYRCAKCGNVNQEELIKIMFFPPQSHQRTLGSLAKKVLRDHLQVAGIEAGSKGMGVWGGQKRYTKSRTGRKEDPDGTD